MADYKRLDDHQEEFITVKDLKIVYNGTFDARNKWQNILLALNISKATIESIGTRCRDNPDDCYREGLTEWLKGGERSWRELVEALSNRTVGHDDIATEIERAYIQSATNAPSIAPTHSCLSKCKLEINLQFTFM